MWMIPSSWVWMPLRISRWPSVHGGRNEAADVHAVGGVPVVVVEVGRRRRRGPVSREVRAKMDQRGAEHHDPHEDRERNPFFRVVPVS